MPLTFLSSAMVSETDQNCLDDTKAYVINKTKLCKTKIVQIVESEKAKKSYNDCSEQI